jgi:AcrR family transcriptional regulator
VQDTTPQARSSEAENRATEARIVEAADQLFYRRGIQAVSIDEIRSAAGVSLKRLYQVFPSKTLLVEAFLRHRETKLRTEVNAFLAGHGSPYEQILAVYDWIGLTADEPGFRGCAFINTFGELGATSHSVAGAARKQKLFFQQLFAGLLATAAKPAWLADPLVVLAEGAIATAAISGSPDPATQARTAACVLLDTSASDALPARNHG